MKDQAEINIITFFINYYFHYMIKIYGQTMFFPINKILKDKIKKKLLRTIKGAKTKKTYPTNR